MSKRSLTSPRRFFAPQSPTPAATVRHTTPRTVHALARHVWTLCGRVRGPPPGGPGGGRASGVELPVGRAPCQKKLPGATGGDGAGSVTVRTPGTSAGSHQQVPD